MTKYFSKIQRNPPQKKKSKGNDEKDSTKTDDQGNSYWELDRNRRVSLSSFKGKQYLNIREYYLDKSSGEGLDNKILRA